MVSWGLAMLATLALVAGCEAPARVKPWRHAPDPVVVAAHAPGAPATGASEPDLDAAIAEARPHTLRIQLDAEPGRLSPLVAPTIWARRITLGTVFEPLIRYVPPGAGEASGHYAPRLARSWDVVSPSWGGIEVRLDLQPGVTFHDGHPLTSSDVQFTLDAVRDARRGVDHLRPLLEDVDRVELITPTEVRLVLKRPSGKLLRALAEIPILPLHVYGTSLTAGGTPIGSGPYRVASTKGGVVHLTRFDTYWGARPAIADVEYIYEPDAFAALKDARRGGYDIIPALIPAHHPEQATAPGIAAAFVPLELRPLRLRFLAFNATRAPLDDARVRHALALLVNRQEIAELYFDRLARPAQWPIWPGGFIHGTEPPVPDFDPRAAAELLAQAGWRDADKNGILERDGAELSLTMIGGERPKDLPTAGPGSKLPRDYVIEAARRIGILVKLKTGGDAWIDKQLEESRYDLVEMVWTGMADADTTGRLGVVPLAQPAVVHVLDALVAAWQPADRARLAPQLAAAFTQAWPFAGVVADAPQGLVHRRVQGLRVWDGWIDVAQLSFK